MKQFFRKALAVLLALSLLSVPAAASEAMGEDLTGKVTQLGQDTQLTTNTFWSTAYSDLRTENFITYTPNESVTPIVTYGSVVTDRSTVSNMAKKLESQSYRVIAGLNGDFYNVNNGLPIGILVSDGVMRSSDAGYYAIGFRADGTAVLGKPQVKVSADLGYTGYDSVGSATEIVRHVAAVNKARVSTGGIYLYTYDFNSTHTTGNTETGIDVVCTITDGSLSIGGAVTLTVDRVVEATAATAIGENQMVLSVNLKSDSYYVDALRNVPVGSQITVSLTASSSAWDDVQYALGALYSLVENGSVVSGLQAGSSPRTAVGQKADGTLIFYTIDGRKSGHSIGATMTQVAQRLIELGCVNALCLDGGGSTTLSVTKPDQTNAYTINTPSDGSERSVTNQIFLVADSTPSGILSHFYVGATEDYVLAGSKVTINASAVDTNYIPMEQTHTLTTSAGTLNDQILTTPLTGGDITVTATGGGQQGTTVVHAVTTPSDVAIRNSSNAIITSMKVTAGSTTKLTATAAYRRVSLYADPEAFTWTVTGNIGTIDDQGTFTAADPSTVTESISGTITVSAGGVSAAINVTVTELSLKTLENFEDRDTVFSGVNATLSQATGSEHVRLGQGAGKVDYTLDSYDDYTGSYASELRFAADRIAVSPYTLLTMWVYGDNSGNTLYLEYFDGTSSGQLSPITTLGFTGWKQVAVPMGQNIQELEGLVIQGSGTGTIYLDQLVLSYNNIMDDTVPEITLETSGTALVGTISDAVDSVLPKSSVSVTWDGEETNFTYNETTGAFSTSLVSDGNPHRITVTAVDASGNIGRASYDVPVAANWQPNFKDTKGYWGATYADFLLLSGITTGYADGTFRPNQNITRAQFAAMLYRYLGLEANQYTGVTLPFADTDAIPDYALPAIRALYAEGVINGSTGSDGQLYFNPSASLTRAQAATMIGRTQAKGYATVSLSFSDADKIPSYATYYIQTMAAQGVIGGYTDGTFRPNSNITRGQMAKILYNLM